MTTSNKTGDSAAAIAQAFTCLNRAVWLVTAQAGERRGGLAATWVSQASLDPAQPTVLAGLAQNHFTCELIVESQVFGLHLPRVDQAELALRFCLSSGRDVDKLAGLSHTIGPSGAPLLTDCHSRFECRVFARLATGDRTYFWADVLAGELLGEDSVLTEQALLAAATPEQRTTLGAQRQADVELHRPWADAWRENLPPLLAPTAERPSQG